MEFREATDKDIEFVCRNSASRSVIHEQPEVTDYRFCLEHEGHVLGAGGIRLITLTTAWAWVDITSYAAPYMKTGFRVISEWMAKLAEQHKIRRLQAYVDMEFPEAVTMVEHLGFTRESIMWDFLGDRPAALYVRIYQWDY